MNAIDISHLSFENQALLADRDRIVRDLQVTTPLWLWWRPCTVRVLILADGLDFNPANGFGLSTFVQALLDIPGHYVRFAITLAHIDALPVAGAEMMASEPRITNRITGFKFDSTTHFAADRFDVVFLFGIETFYSRGAGYPSDSLSDNELQVLAQFQNAGGGLFATGDHGSLGRAMCHKVARARGMRLWNSTGGIDEVSMDGPRRNDTNRLGHDTTSEFDDQSDDIPQPIAPVFYSRTSGIFRYSFPHPLLCGPNGPIRVMPDHPHEGQCAVPADLSLTVNYTAPLGPEYPPASGAWPRPVPEIISHNSVLTGTTSSGKDPTAAQTFPGIAAYDGHRAGIGRVATDATWHHFVNVNLTGIPTKPVGDPKRLGFLASPAGQAHFENIKAYYRNLAVWLSPPARIRCMNSHLLWHVLWHDRVLEAVLTARDIGIDRIGITTLALIGRHARDVLGRYASQCQTRRIIIDLLDLRAEIALEIDPWKGGPAVETAQEERELAAVDYGPALDAALGGALVAISDQYKKPTAKILDKLQDEEVLAVARKGAAVALERADRSIQASFAKTTALLARKVKR